MSTKKIVITGGPGTGKTSIINTLKEKGFFCFDEVIRALTLEAKKDVDKASQVSNPIAFANNPMDFNTRLLNGRIDQFKLAESQKKHLSFFDRGIPDVLAYMDYFNQQYDNLFTNACKQHKYTSLFILPPWKAIYKTDNERFETFEEAEKIHEHLLSTYKKFGYQITEVPFGTVENRTKFILDTLNL
ncbi:AAA family ATPase [Algibacter sp. PT7-4]|uniref:AAA family ATPase n=1 Tax=Algibacter ulvanivorans TaxID=3400999 RepID=UPI003AAF65AC